MSIRTQVCAWTAAFALAVPSVAGAQDRTERELLDLIVRDGPRARAIRAETEVLRREQFARLAYPNPTLMYSREGAGFTEFLQAEQPLPLFGVRRALARAGVEATGAAEADRDARLWVLRAEAAGAIARLLAEQERLQAAEAHIGEIERMIDVVRTREQEGEGSRFDRLRFEQELRDARQSRAAVAVAVAAARATVSGLLPRDTALGRVAAADTERSIPQQETLIDRARATRAELRALERTARRAEFEADAARRSRLPSPTVFGGLKRADDIGGREQGGVFGLSLSLPVFDGGGREAARWAAERARVDFERAAIEQQIRAEITRASEVASLRQAALSEDQPAAADELMRIAEIAYREGEVNIVELIDAVRTASRARFRSIDIRLEVRLAQLALERAVGGILWP